MEVEGVEGLGGGGEGMIDGVGFSSSLRFLCLYLLLFEVCNRSSDRKDI